MSDERKFRLQNRTHTIEQKITEVKESKTQERFESKSQESVITDTNQHTGNTSDNHLISDRPSQINQMSNPPSFMSSSSNSLTRGMLIPPVSVTESKSGTLSSLTQDMSLGLQRQPSSDGPSFGVMLGDDDDYEEEYSDDSDDSDDSNTDDDLPMMMPGGMPVNFMTMDDDSDDDLPRMVPGLVRQNGYYRAETSLDYVEEQRAA